jgi:hypothetical protein
MSILNQVLDLLRTGLRNVQLRDTRGVASFHDTGIARATLVIGLLWAAIASAAVALAWLRQARPRPVSARTSVDTSGAAPRRAVSPPASQWAPAADLVSNDDQRQEALQP